MKKIIVSAVAVIMGALSAYSQGTVTIANTGSAYYISTNATSVGGGTGVTALAANGFYYTVLYSAYDGSAPGNSNAGLLSSDWAWTGVMGTNATTFGQAGGIKALSSAIVSGWDAPSSTTYATGTTNYYVIVGWSASLGSTWAAVSNQLASATWNANGFFGTSLVSYEVAGGGPSSLNAVNLFGTSQTGVGGLASGFTLYAVQVPEPSTIALAGLGAASLLMFRRRK